MTNRTLSLHLEHFERVPRSTGAVIPSTRSIGRMDGERAGGMYLAAAGRVLDLPATF